MLEVNKEIEYPKRVVNVLNFTESIYNFIKLDINEVKIINANQ